MMAVRLLEMRRLLKPTGSIYLHCDPYASHYLKQLLDATFGANNYRNELIWHYSGWNAQLKRTFNARHDCILFYATSSTNTFNSYSVPWESEDQYAKAMRQKQRVDENGRSYVLAGARRVSLRYEDIWMMPCEVESPQMMFG